MNTETAAFRLDPDKLARAVAKLYQCVLQGPTDQDIAELLSKAAEAFGVPLYGARRRPTKADIAAAIAQARITAGAPPSGPRGIQAAGRAVPGRIERARIKADAVVRTMRVYLLMLDREDIPDRAKAWVCDAIGATFEGLSTRAITASNANQLAIMVAIDDVHKTGQRGKAAVRDILERLPNGLAYHLRDDGALMAELMNAWSNGRKGVRKGRAAGKWNLLAKLLARLPDSTVTPRSAAALWSRSGLARSGRRT